MGFHINVYNMPRLETYDKAREYFIKTTAVRGEDQSIRRLGDRYEKEKWLRQEIQDGIEVYVAGYYNTDLVRFYPTHKEITLGGYPSTSTQYFVEFHARVNLNVLEHKRYVPAPFTKSPMVANSDIECMLNNDSDRCLNAYSWYRINYDGTMDDSQFMKPRKYVVDSKQMRELRKPYKNLLKYIDTLLKLNNEGMEKDNAIDNQIRAYEGGILEFLVQESNMYQGYYHLVNRTQSYRWINSNRVYYSNMGMVKRYLDKLIKLSNPQVLVEVKPTNNLTT